MGIIMLVLWISVKIKWSNECKSASKLHDYSINNYWHCYGKKNRKKEEKEKEEEEGDKKQNKTY